MGNLKSLLCKAQESQHLLTLIELKEIASTIALGIGRRVTPSDKTKYATDDEQSLLQDRMNVFFDQFLPSCDQHYASLENQQGKEDHFNFDRRGKYALDPPTIRLFANCWARVAIDHNQNTEGLANAINQLNLQRSDPGNDFSKKSS